MLARFRGRRRHCDAYPRCSSASGSGGTSQHAYAITVHRSQGSEYPGVVMPLTMSSYTLLQRNLLYTAVTRAKRLVALAIRLLEPDAGSNDSSVCTSPA